MFVLQCRKISYLNPSVLCFRKFAVAKKFMDKRGGEGGWREYHDFPSEVLLSHSAEKFRRGTIQCVTISGYRKILCFRGLSQFYVEVFLSHSTEKIESGTLLCCVSENFP